MQASTQVSWLLWNKYSLCVPTRHLASKSAHMMVLNGLKAGSADSRVEVTVAHVHCDECVVLHLHRSNILIVSLLHTITSSGHHSQPPDLSEGTLNAVQVSYIAYNRHSRSILCRAVAFAVAPRHANAAVQSRTTAISRLCKAIQYQEPKVCMATTAEVAIMQ